MFTIRFSYIFGENDSLFLFTKMSRNDYKSSVLRFEELIMKLTQFTLFQQNYCYNKTFQQNNIVLLWNKNSKEISFSGTRNIFIIWFI